MRSALLASSYSTPGRRAFGSRGTLPEGFMWAKMDWGGLNIAEGVVTNFTDEVRPPCFVSASVKLAGQKPVRGLYFVQAFVHEDDAPEIVLALGDWAVDNEWLMQDYTKTLGAPTVAKLARKFPGAVALRVCESGVVVERWGAPPAVGRVENDVDVHCLVGVVHSRGSKQVVTELEGEWGVPRLLGLLPSEGRNKLMPGAIRPPSGLVPHESDFEPIEPDACRIDGRTILIGGAPCRPLHAIRLDASGRLGQLLGRPHNGVIRVRELPTLADPRVAPLLGTAPVHERAWGRSPSSQVVFLDNALDVAVAALPRPIEPITVVPQQMYHTFRLSSSRVRSVQLRLDEQAPRLTALQQPFTPAHTVRELVSHATDCAGADAVHAAENLCNEIFQQVTPEKTAQPSLSDARVVVRGFDFAVLLVLMAAAGRELVWLGDRALTFEYYFTDLDDLCLILKLKHAGWIVPEKEPARNGAKRQRLARHKGYMLVYMHDDVDGRGSNFIRYSLELRKLEIGLSVGFFGENLEWVRGAQPPPAGKGLGKKPQYDIVDREWRKAKAMPPLSLPRADAHFEQELIFGE